MHWQTSRRKLSFERTLVMGILNVTPDSFSDGGQFELREAAVDRAGRMIAEGADIIDIGGESTRPGSTRVSAQDELDRVIPVIESVRSQFEIPISVDTNKSQVAEAAINAGAEIINDISGLRFDPQIADMAAKNNAGLVLMHSRGEFETMHQQPPLAEIFGAVKEDFQRSVSIARDRGVKDENIALDVGIGFGKTPEQNIELIAKLDRVIARFPGFPMLAGASRKSFIGRLLGGSDASNRLSGSLAAAAIAAWNGAKLLRVHDVRETIDVLKIIDRLRERRT